MKELHVTLMPWKWEGSVLVGGTPDQFRAYAKKTVDGDVEVGSNSAGHTYVAYGKPWLIWVDSLANLPALAHEALHATCGVLEGRGLKHTSESEEAYCYTMEDILRQVLNAKRWTPVPV